MMDLMLEMQSVRVSLDNRLVSVRTQLAELKNELAGVRAEMVTKEVFQSLEVRVSKLEVGGIPNSKFPGDSCGWDACTLLISLCVSVG